MVPRVKIRDGTPKKETPMPLNSPTAAPISSTQTSIFPMLPPSCAIIPVTEAASPSTAPMETSISPVMMTKAIPIASKVYMVAVLKQAMMLE